MTVAVAKYSGILPTQVSGLGDQTLGTLVLDGSSLDARIEASITSASLERTIEGASTVTLDVLDPERLLLTGGYYERRADLLLDDLWFRAVRIEKGPGDQATFTFEERNVARMRRQTKPRKASRAKVTRAEFLKGLVGELPDIEFVCPLLHKTQPIRNAADRPTTVDKRKTRARGIHHDAKLLVKGARADRSQIKIANRILDVAVSVNAPYRAALAMVEAAIIESKLRNLPSGDRDSVGVFQARPSAGTPGISSRTDAMDVEKCAHIFLEGPGFTSRGGAIKLARENPKWTAGNIAQAIEGSAFPDRYDQVKTEAAAIISAYGGIERTPNPDEVYYTQRYEFSRGQPGGPKDEDTWACGRRLADEVHWRWFMVAGAQYFISDWDLIRSAPRMTLSEDTRGVDSIEFALDVSSTVPDQVTVNARASRWLAPPGTVVALDESLGPATGAWIVETIRRADLTDAATEITLTRPKPALAEPASSSARRSSYQGDTQTDGTIGALRSDSHVMRAYRKAKEISDQHMPYVWGGGHTQLGQPGISGQYVTGPKKGQVRKGYDCSGGVSAVLAAAELLDTPLTAASFLAWGKPGEGKYMTVWAKQTGDSHGDHVFIVFTLPGRGTEYWEFGGQKSGLPGGFHAARSKTGFYPRHWEGT